MKFIFISFCLQTRTPSPVPFVPGNYLNRNSIMQKVENRLVFDL